MAGGRLPAPPGLAEARRLRDDALALTTPVPRPRPAAVVLALFLALAALRPADARAAVSFPKLPDGAAMDLTRAERAQLRGLVGDAQRRLRELTGLEAPPVRVVVFDASWRFVMRTGLPPHIGGIARGGAIFLQPLEILDRAGALERVVRHEAVHAFFGDRDWPAALHEAVAHRLSGGTAARSGRAGTLSAGRRTAAEDLEWMDHLAWELECAIEPLGEREWFRRLLSGRADLSVFESLEASPERTEASRG